MDATLPAVLAGDVAAGATSTFMSRSVEPVKSVMENFRFTSTPRRGSVPTRVTDGPEDMGRM